MCLTAFIYFDDNKKKNKIKIKSVGNQWTK
jgi:hypothetical protein